MNKKSLLLNFMLFLFCSMALNAQKKANSTLIFGKTYTKEEVKAMNGVIRCATTEYEASLQKKHPERMTDEQFEAWLAPFVAEAKANKSQNAGIVTIPVVVHVIHSGQAVGVAPNITDNQVISQITVMNQDFRKLSGTPGFNLNPVGADTQIQFALAKVDPNGNPTNGINRVNLCEASWSTTNIDDFVKPTTIWDPTLYMNMWSVNFTDNTLLGYAQFPSNSGLGGINANGGLASTDGVVANFSFFGSSDYNDGTFFLSAPYDKGRTMTHEVGHYLGLRHIWGDNSSCIVNATDSNKDYCLDTPAANGPNGSCGFFDSCPSSPGFDMVENYMDYTTDDCMNIFTNDQKSRITAVMNNSIRRASLKTSTRDVAIPLFAIDAEIKIERTCNVINVNTCNTSATSTIPISLYNRGTSNITSAIIAYSVNGVSQTFIFSGNIAQDKFASIVLPVAANMPSGTMSIVATSVNGVPDDRITNSLIYYQYSSNSSGSGVVGNYTFTLQNDIYGTEISWNLSTAAGAVIISGGGYADHTPTTANPLPAPIVQTVNLTPGCYVFTINDTFGDGIYDFGGFYNLKNPAGTIVFQGSPYATQQKRALSITVLGTGEVSQNTFSIYPNPVGDFLNISKVSNKATYEIFSVTGQILSKGLIKDGKVLVSQLISGNYIIKVSDKNIDETFKFIKQ